MFVGREEELTYLKACYESGKAEMVMLYGRRRIGKTELLRQFASGYDALFHVGRQCLDGEQLQAFSEKILSASDLRDVMSQFPSWEQAFRFVFKLSQKKKVLLLIDEFPYLVDGNPSIPSLLQMLWDEYHNNCQLMLVLCGSSMSFFEKEVLSEKSPLFGRTTAVIKLGPLTFQESTLFFPDYSAEEKLQSWAVLGGTPHYLIQFNPALPFEENVRRQMLDKRAPLFHEVDFLIRQELREPSTYYSILQAVAFGATRISEISSRTGVAMNKLNSYLNNLINLGLIEKEYSAKAYASQRHQLGKAYLRVADPYFRFYFRYVFPSLSELEYGLPAGQYERMIASSLDAFCAMPFEVASMEHLRAANRKGTLEAPFSTISRYFEKTCEMDLVGYQGKEPVLVGECKYRQRGVTWADYRTLMDKVESEGMDSQELHCYLFSRNAFDDKLLEETNRNPRVHLISLSMMVG